MILRFGGGKKTVILPDAGTRPAVVEDVAALRRAYGVASDRGERVAVGITVAIVEDQGELVPGLHLSCDRCHRVEIIPGQEDRFLRRTLASFRETCPLRETNFYVAAEYVPDPLESFSCASRTSPSPPPSPRIPGGRGFRT